MFRNVWLEVRFQNSVNGGQGKMTGEQKSIYIMEDRELRAVKRELRRRRQYRRKLLISALAMLAVACIIIGGGFYVSSIRSSAGSGFKYYTSVTIEYGETLWSLADAYIDYDYYKDKHSYIAEVRSINHLDEDCSIMAGQILILPYFSEEYVI